ncbi:hypothetical protein DFH06DRAFT_1325825 [Mycena polygramma]|nr:hypothetical protein DFH06DRAFT_1325825 [Mycena polygramma]
MFYDSTNASRVVGHVLASSTNPRDQPYIRTRSNQPDPPTARFQPPPPTLLSSLSSTSQCLPTPLTTSSHSSSTPSPASTTALVATVADDLNTTHDVSPHSAAIAAVAADIVLNIVFNLGRVGGRRTRTSRSLPRAPPTLQTCSRRFNQAAPPTGARLRPPGPFRITLAALGGRPGLIWLDLVMALIWDRFIYGSIPMCLNAITTKGWVDFGWIQPTANVIESGRFDSGLLPNHCEREKLERRAAGSILVEFQDFKTSACGLIRMGRVDFAIQYLKPNPRSILKAERSYGLWDSSRCCLEHRTMPLERRNHAPTLRVLTHWDYARILQDPVQPRSHSHPH